HKTRESDDHSPLFAVALSRWAYPPHARHSPEGAAIRGGALTQSSGRPAERFSRLCSTSRHRQPCQHKRDRSREHLARKDKVLSHKALIALLDASPPGLNGTEGLDGDT